MKLVIELHRFYFLTVSVRVLGTTLKIYLRFLNFSILSYIESLLKRNYKIYLVFYAYQADKMIDIHEIAI